MLVDALGIVSLVLVVRNFWQNFLHISIKYFLQLISILPLLLLFCHDRLKRVVLKLRTVLKLNKVLIFRCFRGPLGAYWLVRNLRWSAASEISRVFMGTWLFFLPFKDVDLDVLVLIYYLGSLCVWGRLAQVGEDVRVQVGVHHVVVIKVGFHEALGLDHGVRRAGWDG